MAIQDDFSIAANGDVRHTSGATVYPVLSLHAWLQDLADDAAGAGDDLWDILKSNPSKLDGPRDAAVASRLNLLPNVNIDDTAATFLNFGSIKQASGDVLYSGLKTLGTIVAASPMYVVQNGSKLTKFWGNGHIQILVKVKTAGALIDAGKVRVYSRKFGQTYSDFESDLSAGGEGPAAMATALDSAVVLSESAAAALSSKVSISVGDTTQDIGNGNGGKLYKGTITLSGGCTVQEAYQYLQYITREDSTATINGDAGWKYRALDAGYTPNSSAPFGSFAGGKWFVAQGWWVTGVLSIESQAYQLTAHDGTTQAPPNVISIAMGNLVAGDRVLVARSSGGALITNEFTTTAAMPNGTTVVPVTPSIGADRPSSGVIRINGTRYTYTSRTSSAFTLGSGITGGTVASGANVFIPYIDAVATGTTASSPTFTFSSTFEAVARVRNGSGATPIVPFETTLSVGAAGASANAVRTSDV
jgi:hypothetical protein